MISNADVSHVSGASIQLPKDEANSSIEMVSSKIPKPQVSKTAIAGIICCFGGAGVFILIGLGLLAGTALTFLLGFGLLIIGLLVLAAHGTPQDPSAECDNAHFSSL